MDFRSLRLLYNFNKEFNHQKIRARDLTETECMICSFVYANPACSQDAVVKELRLDKTTVGKALQKLESKGFVVRGQDAGDRRKKALSITDFGAEQISDVMDLHDKWLNEILTALSEEEQKQFEGYCERLITAAEKLAEKQKTKGDNHA